MPRHSDSVERYRPLVSRYFAPEDVDQAMMLMWYESRGRTGAADPRGAGRGLFQLDSNAWSSNLTSARKYYAGRDIFLGDDINDAETNIAVAARTLADRGWGAWSSSAPGRPAAPGQYGPRTAWDGVSYQNRGGGPVSHSPVDVPVGGHARTPVGITAPTGATATKSTYSSREAALDLLSLLSNQIAGGQRSRIEDLQSVKADTSPNSFDEVSESATPGIETTSGIETANLNAPPDIQVPTQPLEPRTDIDPGLYTHPLATGIVPHGIGLYQQPRSHGPHEGIDLTAPGGTPFITMGPGIVTRAEVSGGLGGLMIEIDHGDGNTSLYYHNQENLVSVGDRVVAGQNIGIVGESGNANTPHIHLEFRQGGNPVDPWGVIGQLQYPEAEVPERGVEFDNVHI